MNNHALRFIAILLAALAMGMHLAHALELVPKLQWDADLYLAMQTTLYLWFGRIGPVFEIGALLMAALLAFRLRVRRPAFALTATSAAMLALSLATWAVVVMAANAQIGLWQSGVFSGSAVAPADWMHWRAQWQYGQAGIFVLHLIGFCALLRSVLVAV